MTSRRRELLYGAALTIAFVALRVIPFLGAHIGRGYDTYDYRFSASFPPLSRAFLAGPRPFGYPLYLKAVAHNEHIAVVGQLVAGTLAWLALAWVCARATRHPVLRPAAAFVVLAVGSTLEAVQWDRIVSSEALSTAFGVGVLAALLWLRERWTTPRVALVFVLAFLAMAVRDSNGTFFGVVAVVLVIGVAVRRLPVRNLALVAVLLAVAIGGSVSASMGHRWEGPLKDVITFRVLNSPERLHYFERAGMPLSRVEIAKARGQCVSPTPFPACVTLVNPAFYAWIHTHGRSTYTASLMRFPATTFWEPVSHLRYSIGTRPKVEITTGSDEHAPVSKALEIAFFMRNPPLVAGLALVALALSVVAFARRRRGMFVVAAGLIALAYPHLLLVWVGGALEVTRHSLLASIQLRLGLWLAAVWLLDAVLSPGEAVPQGDNALQRRRPKRFAAG